ncbi:MAG: adenosylmethionine decarboxylase [Chloroflexia bacterium]
MADQAHEHWLYDLWLAEGELLKYLEPLRSILVEAALYGGANIYHEHWHQFEPWGVTGFLLLQESHISIHTWPEEGNFAAVDIFPCGPMDAGRIVERLRERLRPVRERLVRAVRGGEVEG